MQQTLEHLYLGTPLPRTELANPGGSIDSLTPAQLQSVRDYKAYGASGPLTQAELRSIGSYLFGVSDSFTPAQLRAIRDYKAFGASKSLTPAELRSISHFLFTPSRSK
jgi:hypothetical protein